MRGWIGLGQVNSNDRFCEIYKAHLILSVDPSIDLGFTVAGFYN